MNRNNNFGAGLGLILVGLVLGGVLAWQGIQAGSFSGHSANTVATYVSQWQDTTSRRGGTHVVYRYSVGGTGYTYQNFFSNFETVPQSITITYDTSNPHHAEYLANSETLSHRRSTLLAWAAVLLVAFGGGGVWLARKGGTA